MESHAFTRTMTCIVCPFGCRLTVTGDGAGNLTVTGNTCPRGKNYAVSEVTAPVRTLTSAVRIDGESGIVEGLKLLPVKTDKPIPKDKLFEGMKIIHSLSVKPPVKAGCALMDDFIVPGVKLVAGRDI